MTDYKIYSRLDYFAELMHEISRTKTGDRVILATMSFAAEGQPVSGILAELEAAARRGVNVKFMVDANTFLISHSGTRLGPLWFHRDLLAQEPTGEFATAVSALDALAASGVKCRVLNRPRRTFTLPVAGRSHIKFSIINDRVYIGGCNLDSVPKIDFMTGWSDRRTADWLSELGGRMLHTGNVFKAASGKDLVLKVDETATLLVDAGVRGRSPIFEAAMDIIDGAQERLLITCQFFPNDVTARHLLAAQRRGVKVDILYNDPSKHPFPYNLLHRMVIAREGLKLPANFFAQALKRDKPYLHAKLLVSEQAAMMGSHNLVTAGVRLGTAEIAMVFTDPTVGDSAAENLRSQIYR